MCTLSVLSMINRKTIKINIYKYLFLVIIIVLLIPYDIYFPEQSKKYENRIGYYADRIFIDSISLAGLTEINAITKN